jgi:polyisoprenoid-binding protein YceI
LLDTKSVAEEIILISAACSLTVRFTVRHFTLSHFQGNFLNFLNSVTYLHFLARSEELSSIVWFLG